MIYVFLNKIFYKYMINKNKLVNLIYIGNLINLIIIIYILFFKSWNFNFV